MKLIVRMTQNFENKDKIIDLSNVENISNELSKLDSKLNNVNDITKAGLVLNYIFTFVFSNRNNNNNTIFISKSNFSFRCKKSYGIYLSKPCFGCYYNVFS